MRPGVFQHVAGEGLGESTQTRWVFRPYGLKPASLPRRSLSNSQVLASRQPVQRFDIRCTPREVGSLSLHLFPSDSTTCVMGSSTIWTTKFCKIPSWLTILGILIALLNKLVDDVLRDVFLKEGLHHLDDFFHDLRDGSFSNDVLSDAPRCPCGRLALPQSKLLVGNVFTDIAIPSRTGQRNADKLV